MIPGELRRVEQNPVNVFDTVAALGASGLRRTLIQAGLYTLTAFLALISGLLPAVLTSILIQHFAGVSFWLALVGVETLAVVCGVVWLHHKQRKEIRKTILDFPNKGDKRSHYAEWEGKNFNRLLSRFVTYARSANSIDETRADFDRVAWGPTVHGVGETAGHATFQQFFSLATTPISVAATRKSNRAYRILR